MISLIIPTYTLTKELEDLTYQCIMSYSEQVDEVIVAEDGGMFSAKIGTLVDTYLYHSENQGFVKNVNEAWRLAKHEFVAIVNNDTYLRKGKLRDLCSPEFIVCPVTKGETVPLLAGHFFVVPSSVFGRGILDERLHTFCSDADLERRYPHSIVQNPGVEIWHEGNKTLEAAGLMDGKRLEEDRRIYSDICANALS